MPSKTRPDTVPFHTLDRTRVNHKHHFRDRAPRVSLSDVIAWVAFTALVVAGLLAMSAVTWLAVP